jgi:hypothetical protein
MHYDLCRVSLGGQNVDIRDVLENKGAALAQHRSQMERIVADERWLTLEQIAEGEFLERFYQPREFFRRSHSGISGKFRDGAFGGEGCAINN